MRTTTFRLRSVLLAVSLIFSPSPALPQALGALMDLPVIASSTPELALVKVDAALEELAIQAEPDLFVEFDLNRLRADLLRTLGRTAEAADLIADLADNAAIERDTLRVDPVPLHQEAADLYLSIGETDAALDQFAAIVNDQIDGGQPASDIAETFRTMEQIARDAGFAADADAFQEQAARAERDAASNTKGEAGGYRTVQVYYATDRARTGSGRPSRFYGSDRGPLDLGRATVTIPHSHTMGMVEAWSLWNFELGPSPSRHIILRSVTPMEASAYYAELANDIAASPGKQAFVFVHGFNVSFDQAAKRAAQIAYDMNYYGVPIMYSWPSQGSALRYVADTAVVRLSGRRLARFLDQVVEKTGVTKLHLVAHSMGNRALTDALELMALRRGIGPGDTPLFGQVLFAAPDVDADLFQEMLPTIAPIADRLTLYASDEDWALSTSRRLHGNAPRAGQGGVELIASTDLDSIDMTGLGDDMLAHSYFAGDGSAIADMLTLFWRNAAPSVRCGIVANGDADRAWRYEPDACRETELIEFLSHVQKNNVATLDELRDLLDEVIDDDPELAKILERDVAKLLVN